MTKFARTIMIALAVFSLAAVLVYTGVRMVQIRELQNKISAQAAPEPSPITADTSEVMKRKFPVDADVSSFIERLYALAENRNLSAVEITTALDMVKTVRKPGGEHASPNAPTTHAVRIAVEGRYRDIALFVRDIQDIERYNRIISLDMKSGSVISTSIVVEIVTFGEKDAA